VKWNKQVSNTGVNPWNFNMCLAPMPTHLEHEWTSEKISNCDIQGVPGGKDLTSGECSLGQTIPI